MGEWLTLAVLAAPVVVSGWAAWQFSSPFRRQRRLAAFEGAARGAGLTQVVWDEPEEASVWRGEFGGVEVVEDGERVGPAEHLDHEVQHLAPPVGRGRAEAVRAADAHVGHVAHEHRRRGRPAHRHLADLALVAEQRLAADDQAHGVALDGARADAAVRSLERVGHHREGHRARGHALRIEHDLILLELSAPEVHLVAAEHARQGSGE